MAPRTRRPRTTPNGNGHKPAPNADDVQAAIKAGNPAEARKDTFATARGKIVNINGVSVWLLEGLGASLREEFKEAGRPIDPPQYTVILAGDVEEKHDHDASTVKTKEERAAWADHLQAVQDYGIELQERTMKVFFIRGIESPGLEDGSDWIEEQKFLGARVPANKFERKYWWVKTEVISSPEEAIDLMKAIMALSGVGEEAMRAAEATFQRQVEVTERPKAKRTAK